MSDQPRCPKCNTTKVVKLEHKLYRCTKCNMLTDCEDDGTVGRGRPENNASRNEEYHQRQKQRLQRKWGRR